MVIIAEDLIREVDTVEGGIIEIPSGYKLTELGLIPKDWNQVNLGDKAIKIGSGITPTGGENIYKQSGRPFIRSQNIGDGHLLIQSIAFIDNETHESFKSTEVKTGDVLLNITGASIGRCATANHHGV
jgi:type I restriction enzyme, S subunit